MKRIFRNTICLIITAALVCTVTAGTVQARPKEELTPDERVEQILRNMTLRDNPRAYAIMGCAKPQPQTSHSKWDVVLWREAQAKR